MGALDVFFTFWSTPVMGLSAFPLGTRRMASSKLTVEMAS